MAGCSHVGALLFYVHGVSEYKEKAVPSCTSELCSWLSPSLKKVNFSSVNNINFKSADKRYDGMISGCEKRGTKSKAPEERQKLKDSIPCLDPGELQSLLGDVKSMGVRSGLLSTHPSFCDEFIPPSSKAQPPLTSLFQQHLLDLPYHL